MRETLRLSTLLLAIPGSNAFLLEIPKSPQVLVPRATATGSEPVSTTSLSPDELIDLTKKYVFAPDLEYIRNSLSEDFVFRGPIIGPLNKSDYLQSVTSLVGTGVDFYGDVIQDYQPNAFGFSIDPVEPNRVWYFVRERGFFKGDLDSPSLGQLSANGKEFIAPPEARSVTFDANGKVIRYTLGYAADRFTGDNTKGKGGIFGALHVMGVDIPSEPGNPVTGFMQWLGTEVLKNGSPSWSDKIPSWWTDTRKGNEL